MYIIWFSVAILVVNSNAQNRYVDDWITARQGQYPYQAFILHSGSVANGALISMQHVVTTAVAVESLEEGLVIMGALDLTRKGEEGQKFEITKQNIFMHEKFEKETLKFNIALITLPVAVHLTENVQPIKVANQQHWQNLPEGQRVIITGYGIRKSGKPKGLNYFITTIFNPDACEAQFEDIGDQSLCTEKDIFFNFVCCNGEGAPVVLEDRENRRLIGLTTLTQECNDHMLADLSVRVSRFTDWITDKLSLGV